MKKERRRKKYAKRNKEKEEIKEEVKEEEEKEDEEENEDEEKYNNENVELKYNFKEEDDTTNDRIKKYKITILILMVIIIILIICLAFQIFAGSVKNKRFKSNLLKTNKEYKKNKNKGKKNLKIDNQDEKQNENQDDEQIENKSEIVIKTYPPAEKRKIYVQIMDFWPAFSLQRFDVLRILKERYEVIFSDYPDYVIFSEFGGQNYDIENRINCVKLFLSIENRDPNFANTDYAIGIHYIDKGDRYFRKPTETHQLTAIQTVYNVTQVKNIDVSKKKFCAWVVSNGGGRVRNLFFDKLSQYKVVDSGGHFRNNVGGSVGDKIQFLTNYKFSICMENSKTQGYISEKLVDCFEAGTIPIYYGDDTILELLNNKSYIHVRNEDEFDEKIEWIKKIDNNDTLYQEVIREKIVIDDTRYARELQKYKDFIYHIIEQDKEKAKRFPRKNADISKENNEELRKKKEEGEKK